MGEEPRTGSFGDMHTSPPRVRRAVRVLIPPGVALCSLSHQRKSHYFRDMRQRTHELTACAAVPPIERIPLVPVS